MGQEDIEEIDFVTRAAGLGRGGNFGWNILEGSNRYGAGRPARPDELPANYVAPVIEHTHSSGWCSIIGGYVVRDAALPDLYGRYVYGDYCRGEIWSAALGPSGAAGDASTGLHVSGLSSLGEDGCGRVYATSIDGPVYRLATTGVCAGPAPVPFPAIDGPTGRPGAVGRPRVKLRVVQRQKVLRAGYVLLAPRCDKICRVTATGNLLLGKGNEPEAAARAADARRARPGLAQGARPPAGAPPAAGPARRAPAGAGPHDGDRDRRHGQAARRADPGDHRAMTDRPGRTPPDGALTRASGCRTVAPMTRSRRVPLPLAALGALLLLASAALWAPRPAAAALTAGSIRIVDRPASVRVIVHFRGGRLTGLANQVDAIDPDISDGRAVVRVNAPGIRTAAPAAARAGVRGADRPPRRAHRGAAGRAPGVRGALQVRVLPDLGAAQRPGDRPVEGHHAPGARPSSTTAACASPTGAAGAGGSRRAAGS